MKQLHLFGGSAKTLTVKKTIQPKNFSRKRQVGNVLMLGGGVQSTTLLYLSIKGIIPKFDLVLFADTGDEPAATYKHIAYLRKLCREHGIALRTTKPGGLKFSSYLHRFGSMPVWVKNPDGSIGRLKRQCTDYVKIKPNNRMLASWMVWRGHAKIQQGFRVLDVAGGDHWDTHYYDELYNSIDMTPVSFWETFPRYQVRPDVYVSVAFGISTDETYRASERGPAWWRTTYPLIELGMSRDDCIQWIQDNGFPIPPKSACVQCPYRTDEAWLDMMLNHPQDWQEACRIDDFMRTNAREISKDMPNRSYGEKLRGTPYIHERCIPLRDITADMLRQWIDEKQLKRRAGISEYQRELIDGMTCSSNGGFSCHL